MSPSYLPQKIFIEKEALAFSLTRRILKTCRDIPFEVIGGRRSIELLLAGSADPVGEGKKHLFLSRQKGRFIRPCPCTPRYLGCNYFIINAALNCPLDCSYCILQLYLTNPMATVFVNLDDLWKELDLFLRRRGRRFLRLGTGELADSLALDPLTRTARDSIAYFRKKRDVFFELKTKTVNIDGVMECAPAENIVISWSLNSRQIAAAEENGAPPVEDRLLAARQISRRGYPVGFHFDPIIYYPGWEEGYSRAVELMLGSVPSSRIRWISLGSLRFPPALKTTIAKRFPLTKIIYEELVPGRDGKLRYFKPLRLEMFRIIVERIRYFGGNRIPLYFCMEDAEVWREALGWSPGRKEEVELSLSPRMDGQSKSR